MECLLFTACVMSECLLRLQTRPGKDKRGTQQCCVCLDKTERRGVKGGEEEEGGAGLVFGDGILTKQFHLSQIGLQAAQQCNTGPARISCFLTPGIEETC